ncbi:uncharacterized protein LOC135685077 isoform X7 [Rhopilema esculentum]|uniref:uncharacterized protein LOC135685077 isoform X3 n=1 Tax=Rhopilema esculentum TaxID=499914 RepID=UPI0031DE78CB
MVDKEGFAQRFPSSVLLKMAKPKPYSCYTLYKDSKPVGKGALVYISFDGKKTPSFLTLQSLIDQRSNAGYVCKSTNNNKSFRIEKRILLAYPGPCNLAHFGVRLTTFARVKALLSDPFASECAHIDTVCKGSEVYIAVQEDKIIRGQVEKEQDLEWLNIKCVDKNVDIQDGLATSSPVYDKKGHLVGLVDEQINKDTFRIIPIKETFSPSADGTSNSGGDISDVDPAMQNKSVQVENEKTNERLRGSASPNSGNFDFAAIEKGDFPESKALSSITGSDAKETASENLEEHCDQLSDIAIADGSNNKGADTVIADGSNDQGADIVIADGSNDQGADIVIADGSNDQGADIVIADGSNDQGADIVIADGPNDQGADIVIADGSNDQGAGIANADGSCDQGSDSRLLETLSGLTIEDLDQDLIHSISNLLDKNGWEPVAGVIFCNEDDVDGIIITLRSCQAGGGQPALNFIRHLFSSHPSENVGDFKQKLMEIGRENVIQFINEVTDDKLLSSLSFDKLSMLSGKLEFSQKSVKYWKHLAPKYNLSKVDIAGIESTKVEYQHYSPTEALIQALYMRKPEYKVSEFIKVLEDLKFNKVVDIIKEKYLPSSD